MAESIVDHIAVVGVVGCGTMGGGIAEIVARHGLPVHVVEMSDEALERGLGRIRGSLERQVTRGKLTAREREAILGRISGSTAYRDLTACDLIIEAVPEVLAFKQEAFRQIDAVARADAIIATNTSSLPVMDVAVHTARPNRVLGFHFFNPAPVMKLIELVRTAVTDEAVVETTRRFAGAIGKVPVVVGDRRGFIVNHLLVPYLNQAIWMVEGGDAIKEDVDAAMCRGAGLPMGPIALTDLVGIDTFLGIMDAIHTQFPDPRFTPHPILRQLVGAGFSGRKSGRGFYTYDAPGSPRVVPDEDIRPPADPALIESWTSIGVVGTDAMATGIVEVCADAGFGVRVWGPTQDEAGSVVSSVSRSLRRQLDAGRRDAEELRAALQRIRAVTDLVDLADCDLVIEAVAGDHAVEDPVFAELSQALGADAVLATTTSSSPVIGRAMATDRPERVLGLHLVEPPARTSVAEIVPTVRTDRDVTERVRAFVERIGWVGVLGVDRAGSIVDTLLLPYLNDAVKMLTSHYATAEEIDTAMKLGCGYPLGPFERLDVMGLDTALATLERLQGEYRQSSYQPAPLLRHMVDAGLLGRKVGRGFYVYD